MAEKKSLSGYWRTTFLIGLGFFTMGLMDPLYDNYIPMFLGYYINSSSLVGAVMTLDNILAIFLIPVFSALSDRTRTRIGRRMPYIITLLPLSAIFFALVPFSALESFLFLFVTIFFLNIFKQAVRGPVVALMPDMVPADLRSEANGVINTMGGLATILGTILLARLMDVKINLPGIGAVDKILAFPVASIFVLLAVVLLFVFVKENKSTVSTEEEREEKAKEPLLKSLKEIFSEKEKSALFILLSLLCWFIAYQGILQEDAAVFRPILSVPKRDIITYLSGEGLSWSEDSTNGDTGYLRNSIRHHLMPVMTESCRDSLSRIASSVAAFRRRFPPLDAGDGFYAETGRDAFLSAMPFQREEFIYRALSRLGYPGRIPRALAEEALRSVKSL